MKNLFLLTFAQAIYLISFGQSDSISQAPYKRFPNVPPFKILLTDSITHFTKDDLSKKKSTMLMLFSPDCDHCKHETEEIIKNIESFKKIQIVMSTTLPFEKMIEFYNKYELNRFENITVGKDVSYFFPVFFDVHNLPFLAFYNKKQELISVFSGSLGIDKILEELDK